MSQERVGTLDKVKVPPKEKDEVLKTISAQKADMVEKKQLIIGVRQELPAGSRFFRGN